MSNEIVVTSLVNKNHNRLSDDLIDRVKEMLRQDVKVQSYGVRSSYSDEETLTLRINDKTTLTMTIQVSKG